MHAAASTTESDRRTGRTPGRFRWRVVDIVIASVIGVACAAVFLLWNVAYQGPSAALTPLLPGLQGLLAGPWLIAGVLGGLIIRKPGAALFVELLAATGLDAVLLVEYTLEFARQTPEEFVRAYLVDGLHAGAVVISLPRRTETVNPQVSPGGQDTAQFRHMHSGTPVDVRGEFLGNDIYSHLFNVVHFRRSDLVCLSAGFPVSTA